VAQLAPQGDRAISERPEAGVAQIIVADFIHVSTRFSRAEMPLASCPARSAVTHAEIAAAIGDQLSWRRSSSRPAASCRAATAE
jgi:hypothetical protein